MVGTLIIIAIAAMTLNFFIAEQLLNGQIKLLIENINHLIAGILLQAIASFIVVWVALLLYPIIRHQNRITAMSYACLMSFEGISLLLGALASLYVYAHVKGIIGISNQSLDSLQSAVDLALKIKLYVGHIAKTTALASSLLLCYSMFQSRIIPRYLSVFGFVGYICTSLSELLTTNGILHTKLGAAFLLSAPATLWEFIAFPLWLLIMGFNPPTNQSCREDAYFLSMKGRDQTNMQRGKILEEGQERSYRSIGKMVGALTFISSITLALGIAASTTTYQFLLKNSMLFSTDSSAALLASVLLLLISSFIIAWITFLLYPLIKEQSRTIALCFTYFTIAACLPLLFIAFADLYIYSYVQGAIGASNQNLDSLRSGVDLALRMKMHANHIASVTFGVLGLFLSYSMFQSRIIPKYLAAWGFGGYVCALLGGLLTLTDVAHTTPVAVILLCTPNLLWAFIAFPLWLLIKGFNPPTPQLCKQAS
jgi:hypothetical protein